MDKARGGSLYNKLGGVISWRLQVILLGGPEIYSVANNALTAGLPGKSTANICDVQLAVSGREANLCSFSA